MTRPSSILITGGAGFIGSAFTRLTAEGRDRVVVVDKLTYAGDVQRLDAVAKNINFVNLDICDLAGLEEVFRDRTPHTVVHFAAETHVDRSLQDANPFQRTNVMGTAHLIQCALNHHIQKFVHISTDEVYGASRTGFFREDARLRPSNPYAESKATAEGLVQVARRDHALPAIIIRPANNYGPWQYPEKFIPVAIYHAMHKQPIPVYGQGEQIREWLFVDDCIKAIERIIEKGTIGEIYNIGSGSETTNRETAELILSLMNRPRSDVRYVKDRPGHDFRYSVDSQKLFALGWKAPTSLEAGLIQTIEWCRRHTSWLEQKVAHLRQHWDEIYQPHEP